MSIQIGANNQLTGIGTANEALYVPRAFTFTLKVKLTSLSGVGSVITLLTRDYRRANLQWNGTDWVVRAAYTVNVFANVGSGAVTSEWVSVALVVTNNTSGNGRVIGYVRRPGGATTTGFADYVNTTTSDEIGRRILIGPLASYYTNNDYDQAGARFIAADAKLWSAALTQTQVEAEFDQQAPVVTSNLMVANDFGGGNISAALTSDTSNISFGGTWSAVNGDGGTESNPTYSSDAPTYSGGVTRTLTGSDTLPGTI